MYCEDHYGESHTPPHPGYATDLVYPLYLQEVVKFTQQATLHA